MTTQTAGAGKCPFSNASEDYKPFDMKNPFPFYEWVRHEAPVFFAEKLGYFVVARYDDVKSVFENWQTFSSENAQQPVRPLGPEAKRIMREGGFTAYSGPVGAHSARAHAHSPHRAALLRPQALSGDRAANSRDRQSGAGCDGGQGPARISTPNSPTTFPRSYCSDWSAFPTADVAKVKAWGANRATLTWGDLSDEEQIPHAHAMVDYWRYCRDIVTPPARRTRPTICPAISCARSRTARRSATTKSPACSTASCSRATRPRPT